MEWNYQLEYMQKIQEVQKIEWEYQKMMEIQQHRLMELEQFRMMEFERHRMMEVEQYRMMEFEQYRMMELEQLEQQKTIELEQKVILEHLEMIGFNKQKLIEEQQMRMTNSEPQVWKYISRQVPKNKSTTTIKLGLSPFKLKKGVLKKHFYTFHKKFSSKTNLKIKNIYSNGSKEGGFYAYVTFTNEEDVDACFQLDEDDIEENCETYHEIQGVLIPIIRAPTRGKSTIKK